MDRRFEKPFQKLATHHASLISVCSTLPDPVLNAPMAPGKWSVAQLTDHLHQSMHYTLTYMNKKMLDPAAIETNRFLSFYRKWLLNMFLNSDIRFKAPEVVSVVPGYISLAILKNDHEKLFQQYSAFLDRFPAELHGKNVFKHPLAGRIRMVHTLEFLDAHLRHHRRQVDYFLKHVKS